MSELAAAPVVPPPRANLYLVFGASLTALAIAVALLGLAYSPYAPAKVDLLIVSPRPARPTSSALTASVATC
jgi:hypothetical protein